MSGFFESVKPYDSEGLNRYLESYTCTMRRMAGKVNDIQGMQINQKTLSYIESLEREIEFHIATIGLHDAYDSFLESLLLCRKYKKSVISAMNKK